MEELEFSRPDLEGLARKLTAIEAELSGPERALLLAIFRVAAEYVSPVLPPASADLVELRKQLIQSFLPDTGNEFIIPMWVRPHRPPP